MSNIEITENIVEIFEQYFTKYENTDICWEWEGVVNMYGYGHFSIKRKTYLAHRISYLIYRGDIYMIIYLCCINVILDYVLILYIYS